jgi:nucleotide-binding universal stress UspA family protein
MTPPAVQPQFSVPPRHVVCPTDMEKGSLDSVRTAFQVARMFQSKLTFISVDATFVYHAELLAASGGLTAPSIDPEKQKQFMKEKSSELKSYLTPFSEGVSFDVIMDFGDPSVAFLSWLQDGGQPRADLVVVGRKNRGALGRFLLGSTATNILEEARVPVLLVPEKSVEKEFKATRVCVASDLQAFDDSVPLVASTMAKAWKGTCTLVHAYEIQDYRPIPPEYFTSAEVYQELSSLFLNAGDIKQKHLDKEAANLASRYEVKFDAALLQGSVKETLLGYIHETKPSLLVVGRVTERSSFGTWLLGSTARSLAMNSECPVLVVPHFKAH